MTNAKLPVWIKHAEQTIIIWILGYGVVKNYVVNLSIYATSKINAYHTQLRLGSCNMKSNSFISRYTHTYQPISLLYSELHIWTVIHLNRFVEFSPDINDNSGNVLMYGS